MLIRNTSFHLVERVAVKGSPLFRSPAVDPRVAEMELNRIVDKHICILMSSIFLLLSDLIVFWIFWCIEIKPIFNFGAS